MYQFFFFGKQLIACFFMNFSNILIVILPISLLLLFSPLSPFPKEPPFPIAPIRSLGWGAMKWGEQQGTSNLIRNMEKGAPQGGGYKHRRGEKKAKGYYFLETESLTKPEAQQYAQLAVQHTPGISSVLTLGHRYHVAFPWHLGPELGYSWLQCFSFFPIAVTILLAETTYKKIILLTSPGCNLSLKGEGVSTGT